MIFRQLFDADSSGYTYLLGCPELREAALIDPVRESVDRDLKLLDALGLRLVYTLDTHHHADHLTGASRLRQLTGCAIAYPAEDAPACADLRLREGEPLRVGSSVVIQPIHTPGHTSHHYCFLVDNGTQKMLFTGDALLIDGCGRTDFQSGSAEQLYRSIHERLFVLPDETLVYPGHDYEGRFVSSVGQEKLRNPRLGGGRSMSEFVALMNGLKLPYPRRIDFAVPGNRLCGECPEELPEELRARCERYEQG